jgi:hypothetical protein
LVWPELPVVLLLAITVGLVWQEQPVLFWQLRLVWIGLHETLLLMVTVALYWKELLVVLLAVTIGLVWSRLRGIPLLIATVGWVWPLLLVSTVVFVLSGLPLSLLLTITLGLVWLQGCLQYFSGNGGYGTIKHFNYDQPNPAYYGHLNGQFSL